VLKAAGEVLGIFSVAKGGTMFLERHYLLNKIFALHFISLVLSLNVNENVIFTLRS
jgi:hypothetical protein